LSFCAADVIPRFSPPPTPVLPINDADAELR